MDNITLQQACENTVGFLDQPNGKIFLSIVKTSTSVSPATKFCYRLTLNENNPDLTYWLLGICENIESDDISSVSVSINGIPVTPSYEITTVNGVYGLKFNHGLEDKEDFMDVCVTFNTAFEIGPNSVVAVTEQGCQDPVFRKEEDLCGPFCGITPPTCDTTVFQTIDVCVPVTVTASAYVGPISVICCGNATVSDEQCPEEGETEITFYVRRRVCAIIPVDIDVDAVDGPATVDLIATSEEGCQNCPGSDS